MKCIFFLFLELVVHNSHSAEYSRTNKENDEIVLFEDILPCICIIFHVTKCLQPVLSANKLNHINWKDCALNKDLHYDFNALHSIWWLSLYRILYNINGLLGWSRFISCTWRKKNESWYFRSLLMKKSSVLIARLWYWNFKRSSVKRSCWRVKEGTNEGARERERENEWGNELASERSS